MEELLIFILMSLIVVEGKAWCLIGPRVILIREVLEPMPWSLCHSYLEAMMVVVVVLPNPFQGMGAWRNSTETQQSSHTPRSGPEVKNGRSSAKDGAPEKLGCGTIQEEVSRILQRVSACAA